MDDQVALWFERWRDKARVEVFDTEREAAGYAVYLVYEGEGTRMGCSPPTGACRESTTGRPLLRWRVSG
jgi:hypothetical protein